MLGGSQSGIQRQYFGEAQVGPTQYFGGIANFPLAGQEHQHVAGALALAALKRVYFIQGGEDRLVDGQILLDAVTLLVLFGGQRPVPGLHRIGTPGNFDDGRVTKVLGEAFQVDGCRGNNQLEIGPAHQQGLQIAQEKIDVQAALVGLVDNQRVVLVEEAVVLGLGQQDAVGHQLDQAALVALVLETHLIADQLAQRRTDLLGDPGRHTARGQPPRLGVADQAMHAAAQFQTDFRQLGGLARPRLAGDHYHLMLDDGRLDLVALGGDRQGVVVTHRRHTQAPRLYLGGGGLETLQPLRQLGLIRPLVQLLQLTTQAVAIGVEGVLEVFLQLVEGG